MLSFSNALNRIAFVGELVLASFPIGAQSEMDQRRGFHHDSFRERTSGSGQDGREIRAIRAIVNSIKAGMKGKSLRVKSRAFDYCEPYEDTGRRIATDSRGRVRFYSNDAGSDDSALEWEHYYDTQGRLRFVFITGGAVNGSQLEHRIYFDETGKRIREQQTYTKGPGYTFPETWPEDQLQINDPAGKFSSKSPCPEIKGKRKS